MTKKFSSKDWESLSAYLDDQLSTKERTRLEARLQRSQQLRTALEELRITKATIRSQPRLRAPHNFTLTPEMVGKRPLARVYTGFQFAAVMASVLFIFVILGDFMFSGSSSIQPQSALRFQAETGVQSVPTQVILDVQAEGVGEDVVETVIETVEVEAFETLLESPAVAENQSATQLVEELGMEVEQEVVPLEVAPPATPDTAGTSEPEAKSIEDHPSGPQTVEEVPTETMFEFPTSPAVPVPTIAVDETASVPSIIAKLLSGASTVRMLEILTALIAVGLWVAVWILRRR